MTKVLLIPADKIEVNYFVNKIVSNTELSINENDFVSPYLVIAADALSNPNDVVRVCITNTLTSN